MKPINYADVVLIACLTTFGVFFVAGLCYLIDQWWKGGWK